MAGLFSIYGGCREGGFLLAELQISVAILALVVALLYGDFQQIMQGWHRMFLDMQLQDAGRYMCSVLEKDLCYEGRLLTIGEDARGRAKLFCQTGHAGKIYTYTWENTAFYKSTKTTSTTGKNPLFVPDCFSRTNFTFKKRSPIFSNCTSFTKQSGTNKGFLPVVLVVLVLL